MKYDVKKAKAIRLDNATLFDIHKLSEYKEVDNCVAYLFDILSKKIRDYNKIKNIYHKKIILINTKFGDVNFGESNTKLDSCKVYVIEGFVKNTNLKMKVQNCDKTATITSIILQ